MLMTEEQARTKWCPMGRLVTGTVPGDGTSSHNSHQATYNRVVDGAAYAFPKGGACMGSNCAAWQWKRVRDDDGGPDGGAVILTETFGYCGAFGKPEV